MSAGFIRGELLATGCGEFILGCGNLCLNPACDFADAEDANRLLGRAFERRTRLEVEERTVAGTTHGRALEPTVGEGTLGVRAPDLERMPSVAGSRQAEVKIADHRIAQLAVREIGRTKINPGHASHTTFRLRGARNSQPVNTGGRSSSRRRFGSRSRSRCSAIRIWTREKW